MLCFRDRTYCPFSDCALFDDCPTAATPQVVADAREWWGSDDAPICVYCEPLECYKEE